jgi:TBC1 domain family member 8/9
MFNINSLVQKAQSLLDPAAFTAPKPSENLSRVALFRFQFRLPDSQTPLDDITAELSLPSPQQHSSRSSAPTGPFHDKPNPLPRGNIYVGKLHLSESFLCFSTQPISFRTGANTQSGGGGFSGQTHGAGPAGNGFTLPLCAIRRVERLHTANSMFALAITTWNGFTTSTGRHGNPSDTQKFTLELAGSRQACERFCDGLKRGLRDGVKEVEDLKAIVAECYSEYLLSGKINTSENGETKATSNTRDPPDAGLGMMFRYPGDPKKLRDRTKMRLWGGYLRGRSIDLVYMI